MGIYIKQTEENFIVESKISTANIPSGEKRFIIRNIYEVTMDKYVKQHCCEHI